MKSAEMAKLIIQPLFENRNRKHNNNTKSQGHRVPHRPGEQWTIRRKICSNLHGDILKTLETWMIFKWRSGNKAFFLILNLCFPKREIKDRNHLSLLHTHTHQAQVALAKPVSQDEKKKVYQNLRKSCKQRTQSEVTLEYGHNNPKPNDKPATK